MIELIYESSIVRTYQVLENAQMVIMFRAFPVVFQTMEKYSARWQKQWLNLTGSRILKIGVSTVQFPL